MRGTSRARPLRRAGVPVALAGVLLLGGCAAGPDADAAAEVAVSFTAAASAGDGEAACALASDAAREAVEEATGEPCADGVTRLGITAITPDDVVASGRGAVVHADGEAVFLAHSPDGWRVRAAGCTPRGDGPYDCEMDGS
ncbi:hypothetical protein [Clavibacter zhangzhiyongii]|uniref:hypothetical protein n=1 Tax=Clavibacter zhangzhiyongii TaxID=2768071 RepID=UPI001957FF9E|nr:hypothetical protein [Clavibacter zhangzhiyongii]MBM7024658.1 hypothetical protein [Clavibacter zhangzhiyongii]